MQTVVAHMRKESAHSESTHFTKPAASAPPKPGLLRAIVGMLFKPCAMLSTFSQTQGVWAWVPAVCMIMIVLLITYSKSYADSWYFYEDQMAYYTQNPEMARFAPEKPASAPLMTNLIRVGERLAGLLASWVFWSGGLMLVCLFASKSDVRFGTILKLVLWSWLPYIVRGLLQSGYMAVTHDPIFNPGLSGLLVDNTPPSIGQYEYTMVPRSTRFGATLLGYVDIYLFWHIALLVIGVPKFTKFSRKWAWMVVLALTVAWIALRVWVDFARYKY